LGLFVVLNFFGYRYGFDVNRKGAGIENGLIHTLANEMPRVPVIYGEVMRPKFEKQVAQ